MPSCSPSITQTKATMPGRTGFPPELLAAVELFFFTFGRSRAIVGISAELFFAEAFAAMQRRDYVPSTLVQHFLQTLLGSSSYAGPRALSTYYMPVVGALVFAGGSDCSRWCLIHWGIPRNIRDTLELPTRRFIRRLTAEENGWSLRSAPNPSLASCEAWIKQFQKRAKKWGEVVDNLVVY